MLRSRPVHRQRNAFQNPPRIRDNGVKLAEYLESDVKRSGDIALGGFSSVRQAKCCGASASSA